MDRFRMAKLKLCDQIMALDVIQLEQLTNMISSEQVEGIHIPSELLTCERCEEVYGKCAECRPEVCSERYCRFLEGA